MASPTRVWRPGLAATLTAAAAVISFACGGGSTQTASPAASPGKPEVTSIKIGASKIAPYTPLYTAVKLGYFKEEGVDVSIEIGSGGADQLPLVIQGQYQLAVTPITTALQAMEQGLDMVLLPSPTYKAKSQVPEQTATLVRPDGSISSLKDLEGKKVAVNLVKSVNWLYNIAMLDKAGVNLSKVTYVEVPFPSMLDALTNKSVDAIVQVQPFVYLGESTGKAKVLKYDFLETQPGVKLTAYGASRQWATKNPNTMAAVRRALMRAVQYLTANPDKVPTLISEYTGVAPAVAAGAGVPSWATDDLTAADMKGVMDLMIKYKALSKTVDSAKLLWAAPKK